MSRRGRRPAGKSASVMQPSQPAPTLEQQGFPYRFAVVIAGACVALLPWLGGRLPLDAEPVPATLLSILAGMTNATHLAPLALACVAMMWLFVSWNDRRQNACDTTLRAIGWIVATAALLYTVSWLVSPLRGVGPFWWALWLLCVAMGVWCARSPMGLAVVSAGLWLAGLGVSRQVMWEHAINDVGWRCFGPFMTPNMLAAYLCLSLPLALMAAVYAVTREHRADLLHTLSMVLCVAVLLIQGTSLIYTGSRFGAVAGALGLVVALAGLVYIRRVDRRVLLLLLFVVAIWGVGYLKAGQALSSRVVSSADTQSHSGAFRMMTWKGALRMIQASPVAGHGPGSFDTVYPRYALVGYTRLAHSAPLQAAAESGIPFAALIYVMGGAVLITGWRRLRQDTPVNALLRCGLLGGAAASLAHGLIDSDWSIPAVALTTALVWGACCNGGRMTAGRSTSVAAWRSPAWLASVMAVCVLAPLAYVAVLSNSAGLAAPPDRAALWERATRAAPWDPSVWHQYALAGTASGESPEVVLRAMTQSVLLGHASRYHVSLALYRWNVLHDSEGALKALSAAAEADPTSLQPLLLQAEILREQGRMVEAAERWKRVLAIQKTPVGQIRAIPELVELGEAIALTELGCYLEQQGVMDQATAYWRDAAELLSRDASFRRANPAMDIPVVGMKARLLERTRSLLQERGIEDTPIVD